MLARKQGFTLVELSIVLVILGLLVGGILAGQSLIRASELRSVIAERDRYITALNSFRDKYFALPGDITNATAFWGKDNTRCSGHTGTTATPGTCNGSGDNIIVGSDEMYRVWQHLALAGLIEGTFTGYISPNSLWATAAVIGRDVPASKASGGGWMFYSISQASSNSSILGWSDLPDVAFTSLLVGSAMPTTFPYAALIKPEEAWNIDTKTDDGKPGQGKVRTGIGIANCATTNVSTTAVYSLSESGKNCVLGFLTN